jgi:hypothetical protein
MSRIRNFKHFRFSPFNKRIGGLKVTNYYLDDDGTVHPFYLDEVPFADFKILKVEPNQYYGKEAQYKLDEESGFYYTDTLGAKISPTLFKNRESSYVVAYFKNINHDEVSPKLEVLCDRLFELTQQEQLDFLELTTHAYQFIFEQLSKNFEEYDD